MQDLTQIDVAVVGGGLSGLGVAALCARAGRRVVLLEASSKLGGRAHTRNEQGFRMMLGPHALFSKGALAELLAELGVSAPGGAPRLSPLALRGGKVHKLPMGPWALLSTSLLGFAGKAEFGRLLARITALDPRPWNDFSVREWLAAELSDPSARELVEAFVRLCTYAHAPTHFSAGTAIRQLANASRGVTYVDGGWATIVEGLRSAARAAGAELRASSPVRSVRPRSGGGYLLEVEGIGELAARNVVLATSPEQVARLLGEATPSEVSEATGDGCAAACLDVALTQLPRPENTFLLGVDEPLYYSVFSASAQLAPEQGAVIHLAHYLTPEQSQAITGDTQARAAVEVRLLALLDLLQPGWQRRLHRRYFSPRLRVCHGFDGARGRGSESRPGPALRGLPGAFVAGDWVGSDGWLADAAAASARAVGRALTAESGAARVAA